MQLMESARDYFVLTESAVQALFVGMQPYLQLLRDVPIWVGWIGDEESFQRWQTEQAEAISASLGRQRTFTSRTFALATLCGAVLQVAAKAIEIYSINTTIPASASAFAAAQPLPKRASIALDIFYPHLYTHLMSPLDDIEIDVLGPNRTPVEPDPDHEGGSCTYMGVVEKISNEPVEPQRPAPSDAAAPSAPSGLARPGRLLLTSAEFGEVTWSNVQKPGGGLGTSVTSARLEIRQVGEAFAVYEVKRRFFRDEEAAARDVQQSQPADGPFADVGAAAQFVTMYLSGYELAATDDRYAAIAAQRDADGYSLQG